MKYLLIMSLSGSTIMAVDLLLRCLLRRKLPARLQYLMMKAAILFYLIPLPFVKKWYVAVAQYLFPRHESISKASAIWAGAMVHAGERIYLNSYLKSQIFAVALWITFVAVLLIHELSGYLKDRRRIIKCADQVLTKEESTYLEQLRSECGVKRQVAVYWDTTGGDSITFGLLKPVILCNQKSGSREAALVLGHELVHVRRMDVCWKTLRVCVILLHFWNPFAWFLYLDLVRVCEWSCDETVVEDRTKEEAKRYVELLVEESVKAEEDAKPRRRWVLGFKEDVKKLRKRMDNIMRVKKWNKVAAGAFMTALVMANSLTVLAYEDTIHVEPQEVVSQDEVNYFVEGEAWQFITDEAKMEAASDIDEYMLHIAEIRFEKQFVDMEGNIYEIQDEEMVGTYRSCNHSYVSGEESIHNKKSDGSCMVRVYDAERCSKCGWILLGELLYEVRYPKCPH